MRHALSRMIGADPTVAALALGVLAHRREPESKDAAAIGECEQILSRAREKLAHDRRIQSPRPPEKCDSLKEQRAHEDIRLDVRNVRPASDSRVDRDTEVTKTIVVADEGLNVHGQLAP